MFSFKLLLKRVFRYLKYFTVHIKEALTWECESCKRCGKIFRVMWNVKDGIWQTVMNRNDDGGGSLCVDCFVKLAEKRGIIIAKQDIELNLFYFKE